MQRSLRKLFTFAGIGGHAHWFRSTFAVRVLQKGVSIDVAALLGNSVKVVGEHDAPRIKSRQDALEAAVKRAWA